MYPSTIRTIFDIANHLIFPRTIRIEIERTITKETIKLLLFYAAMAWKKFTFCMLKKCVISHV